MSPGGAILRVGTGALVGSVVCATAFVIWHAITWEPPTPVEIGPVFDTSSLGVFVALFMGLFVGGCVGAVIGWCFLIRANNREQTLEHEKRKTREPRL